MVLNSHAGEEERRKHSITEDSMASQRRTVGNCPSFLLSRIDDTRSKMVLNPKLKIWILASRDISKLTDSPRKWDGLHKYKKRNKLKSNVKKHSR